MKNINNEIKKDVEMYEILKDLLEKYSYEYLMEKVRDTDGFLRPRWMILKDR